VNAPQQVNAPIDPTAWGAVPVDVNFNEVWGDAPKALPPAQNQPTQFAPEIDRILAREAPNNRSARVEQQIRRMEADGANPAADAIVQGLTYGLSDELGAALQALRGAGNYGDILDAERERINRAKQDNPITATALEVAGAIANPISRTAWAAQAPTRLARLGRGAAEAGILGGIYGFNQGEDGFENRLKQGATSGVVSAAVGGPLNAVLPKARPTGSTRADAQAAENLGVEVPTFVMSDNRGVNALGQAARQIPVLGGKIDDRLAAATEQLQGATNRVAGDLAGVSGAVPDRNTIGTAARRALEKGVDAADARADAAFNSLRGAINADAPVPVPNQALAVLDDIVAKRNAAGDTGVSIDGLQKVVELLTRPEGATFNGLQRARSDLAKAIKFDQRNGGFNQGDLKRAYEALTEAMENAVRMTAKSDPDRAVSQLAKANEGFAKTLGETRDITRFLSQGSDERIVDRIISYAAAGPGKGDLQKLGQLRAGMTQDEWNGIAGYTLHRMGLNQAGEFSPQIFATNFGRMSEQGRNLLFGKAGTQTRGALEDIAAVAKRLADSQKAANFSNTGRGVMTSLGLVGAGYSFSDPIGAVSNAIKLAAVGVPVVALLSRPATASSMARWSQAYERVIRQPTAATIKTFDQASRNLSNTVGSQLGIPQGADALFRQLQGAVRAPAEDQRGQ